MEEFNRTSSAPECHELVVFVSKIIADVTRQAPASWNMKFVLTRVLRPIVCIFGIVGNIFNLAVLNSNRSKAGKTDHLERSSKFGLCALAVSDLMACIVLLGISSINVRLLYSPSDWLSLASIFIRTYQEGVVNVFETYSTWLTVCMALGRYWGICHPLTARVFTSVRATRLAVTGTFVASVAANLPRFWHYHIASESCSTRLYDIYLFSNSTHVKSMNITTQAVQLLSSSTLWSSCQCYHYKMKSGELYNNKTFLLWYGVCSLVVVVIIPFIILTTCNIFLIRALRQSQQFQRQYGCASNGDTSGENSSTSSITVTLIAIIVMFSVLVPTAHIFNFIVRVYRLLPPSVLDVTNFLLLINIAFNFILYCIVNVEFRKSLVGAIKCACLRHVSGHVTTFFRGYGDDAPANVHLSSSIRSNWSTRATKSTGLTDSSNIQMLPLEPGNTYEMRVQLPAIVEAHSLAADIEFVENDGETVNLNQAAAHCIS